MAGRGQELGEGAGVPGSHATPPAPGRPLRMRMPRPQPWGLCVLPLLLLLPPQTPRAGEGRPAGQRAGRGRPLGKEHTKHNPYFPRAALPPSPRVHALLSRSPPLGVSGKHLFPCLQVPVPLSLRLPPLPGSVPFFLGWSPLPEYPVPLAPSLGPLCPLLLPSPLCLSGRQQPLPPVPPHLRVVPGPGDPRLLGVRLAGSTAVPELQ